MEIPNTNGLARGAKHRKRKSFVLAHPEKTNRELAELLGVTLKTVSTYRMGTEYKLGEGANKASKDWRRKVSELLTAQGIENSLVNHASPHNIELTDGTRIKVVYCGKTFLQRQYPVRQFVINKNKLGEYADYFILVAGDADNLYVIPDESTPPSCLNIHIPAMPEKDKKKKKKSKYEKYLNAFYLLRQEQDATIGP